MGEGQTRGRVTQREGGLGSKEPRPDTDQAKAVMQAADDVGLSLNLLNARWRYPPDANRGIAHSSAFVAEPNEAMNPSPVVFTLGVWRSAPFANGLERGRECPRAD